MNYLARFAFVLIFFAASTAYADITIGVAGPFTGAIASWGTSQQGAIKMAIDDINAAGGVSGQKLVAKFYDDACDPKQAVTVANKLISDGLHLIMHNTCSAASLAILKTYLDEDRLLINAFASNPKFTDEGGAKIFRVIYRDDRAGVILADEIVKHFSNKKIAIIHDRSTYGQGIAEYVRNNLNQKKIKEILFEPYDPTNHDYAALATRLKQSGAEVVFVGGFPVEVGLITRQLHDAGSKIQIVAGDLSAPDYWKIAGASGDGALFAFPTDPHKNSIAKELIARFDQAGLAEDNYALYAYVATRILAQAIDKSGSTDPSKIAAYIHTNAFTTALGKSTFDAKGDIQNIHQVLYRWHDGKYAEVAE